MDLCCPPFAQWDLIVINENLPSAENSDVVDLCG